MQSLTSACPRRNPLQPRHETKYEALVPAGKPHKVAITRWHRSAHPLGRRIAPLYRNGVDTDGRARTVPTGLSGRSCYPLSVEPPQHDELKLTMALGGHRRDQIEVAVAV